jgi:acylglycerol lipase
MIPPRRASLSALLLLLWTCACTPLTIPMGAADIQPRLLADKLVMSDGAELPLRVWRPDGQPRAIILGLHGFNDYSKAFAIPAERWVKDGILVYAYDQRGFGRAPNHGIWPGTETFVADLETTTRLVSQHHPGIPLYVLGESMGGAIIMVAASEHRLPGASGVVLATPAVRGRETLNFIERGALWFFSRTVPWLAGQPGSPVGYHPSDNVAVLRDLYRDPLVIKDTRVDAFWGLVNLMDDALAASKGLDTPALIQVGAKDDLIPSDPTQIMLDRMPPRAAGQQRVALYHKGYHMLFRDLNGAVPTDDAAFWILNRGTAAALPSGAERVSKDVKEPSNN